MLKIIGIVAVSWAGLSVLFVAVIWPRIVRRLNEAHPALEKDSPR